jgi:hypothetical protein
VRAVSTEVARIVRGVVIGEQRLDVVAVEHGAGDAIFVVRIDAAAELVFELGVETGAFARKIEPP